MEPVDYLKISDDCLLVDTRFQNTPEAIASWLMRGDDGWVIIDCGSSTGINTLVSTLNSVGITMSDVSRIALTHIHLDHGGATGSLVRDYPHLRVTVHQDSAQILIDPSRLIRSAGMSFGDRMQTLWGEILPVPTENIDVLAPGEMIPGTRLWSIATPGHTATHLSFLDVDTGMLFAGDAAHARLPHSKVIIPTLAPIELDFDAWQATALKLRRLAPTSLALPHFGYVADSEAHLDQIEQRIRSRIAAIEPMVTSLKDVEELTGKIRELSLSEYQLDDTAPETRLASMELAMPSYLGAQGLLRWYKVHGVILEPPN